MNKRYVILAILLFLSLFVSGCVSQQSEIKTQAEASQAITNVSVDIEKLGSALEDIDNKLG